MNKIIKLFIKAFKKGITDIYIRWEFVVTFLLLTISSYLYYCGIQPYSDIIGWSTFIFTLYWVGKELFITYSNGVET